MKSLTIRRPSPSSFMKTPPPCISRGHVVGIDRERIAAIDLTFVPVEQIRSTDRHCRVDEVLDRVEFLNIESRQNVAKLERAQRPFPSHRSCSSRSTGTGSLRKTAVSRPTAHNMPPPEITDRKLRRWIMAVPHGTLLIRQGITPEHPQHSVFGISWDSLGVNGMSEAESQFLQCPLEVY